MVAQRHGLIARCIHELDGIFTIAQVDKRGALRSIAGIQQQN